MRLVQAAVDNPKRELVNLARGSRLKAIREDMVPRPGSGRSEGPAYVSRLIEFASDSWRPSEARSRSESLQRCCQALEQLLLG